MEEFADVADMLDSIVKGETNDPAAMRDIVSAVQAQMHENARPDRAKRRRIVHQMQQRDHCELSAAIDALAKLPRVISAVEIHEKQRFLTSLQIETALHSFFSYETKYAFTNATDFLHAYVTQTDIYLKMESEAFISALLCCEEDVQIYEEAGAFIIHNLTKNIALRTVCDFNYKSGPHSYRQHFLHGSSRNAKQPSTPDTVARFFAGTSDEMCVLQVPSPDDIHCEVRVDELMTPVWWKPTFTWIASLLWRCAYDMAEEAITEDDHGGWMVKIGGTFGIYCYRGPAGEIDTMCFTDAGYDDGFADIANGTEMHETNEMYEWTRACLRENMEIVQRRTLAMFDRVSFFRGEREPFDFTKTDVSE